MARYGLGPRLILPGHRRGRVERDGVAEVQHTHDVRMRKRCRQPCLAPEARLRLGDHASCGAQHLHRDDALRVQIYTAIHDRRPTDPHTSDHLVAIGERT